MHPPIHPAIRTANSNAIVKAFPSIATQMGRNISMIFAIQANGAVDDRTALGPITGPSIIRAITYISEIAAATARNFTLHASDDPNTAVLNPNDLNFLDPRSPTPFFVPGQAQVTVRIERPIPNVKYWVKLSRKKGGSATFAMTAWIMIGVPT